MTLTAGQAALLELVQRYVERQKLVLEAMEQLRPAMVIFTRRKRTSNPQSSMEYFENAKQYDHIPFSGFWGESNEWRYLIHGFGCRLTHTLTGEPIDWDPPDVDCFDQWKFRFYVEWELRQTDDDDVTSHLREELPSYQGKLEDFITDVLEQLHNLGFLSKTDSQYVYKLHRIE